MSMPTIRQVRAFTLRGGGGDYHDQADGHWIDDQISTPMSRWPEYRMTRKSFGIDVLGTLVVEIEASDGTVGFAVTTGGEIGAFIVEKHLARFVEGKAVDRDRDDLGADVRRDPLLRPQGGRAQCDLGRRPRALGPARQGAQGAGACAARRPGARRARLLRHRRAARPGEGDGLHRRQDAAAARPGRGRGRPARATSSSWRRCARRSATTSG